MKNVLTIIIVTVILCFSVWNAFTDSNETDSHRQFFKEMIDFKNKGGRNTSDMGEQLCQRLNILEFHLDEETELTDCEMVYK